VLSDYDYESRRGDYDQQRDRDYDVERYRRMYFTYEFSVLSLLSEKCS